MRRCAAAALASAAIAAAATGTVDHTVAPPATTATVTASVCSYRDGGALPDPVCTPGALNPAVTPATIGVTICKRGWTSTIRPPVSVTGPEKRVSMSEYGVSDPGAYEYDHLVSLELGGAPNDPHNLWPEPHAVPTPSGDQGSFTKDRIENKLRARVCAGSLSLADAQTRIATDWRTALR